MEICGGHTHSISKYGLETVLPESIELIHGLGCPVCVMPRGRLDNAIALTKNIEFILNPVLVIGSYFMLVLLSTVLMKQNLRKHCNF